MINELAKIIHENAVKKGFYEGEKNTAELLCLIHSEVSEALEADREGLYADESVLAELENNRFAALFQFDFERKMKGTFEDELADIIIRTLDLCAYKGINIEKHIALKIQYNKNRSYKHGKKY